MRSKVPASLEATDGRGMMEKILETLERHGFSTEEYKIEGESDVDYIARMIDTVFTWATKHTGNLDVLVLAQDLWHAKDMA